MKTPTITNDYSNFSWEVIQKSVKEIIEEVQRATGATDEQMTSAFSESAQKFMDTNMFEERR